MYKVLFAEDEVLVRLGLKNSIQWDQFDMEVVADEDNGIAAWNTFQRCRPDLVITDIKMGGMDGCELVEHIRSVDQECGIIILSCLEDFKILHNMISYNILGYVLKASMTMDEIHKLLGDAKKYLDGIKQREEGNGHRYLKTEEVLSRYMVHKSMETDQVLTCFKENGRPAPKNIRTMILFEIEENDRDKVSELGITFIQDMVCEELKNSSLFYIDKFSFGILLPEELEEDEEKLTDVALRVHAVLNISLPYYIHTTKSDDWDNLREEYESCQKAKHSLQMGAHAKITDFTMNKAINYIREHYSHQITLKEVAAGVGLSSNYFSAIFKKEMNCTFISYLTCLRVEKAKEMLRTSNEYLYIVAEKSGFQNCEHFSRIFKQKTGKSPANWRKEVEGKRWKRE